MKKILLCLCAGMSLNPLVSVADESLFGMLKGAETLPQHAVEVVQHLTRRYDKGQGTYDALDSKTELEYGITNRLTGAVYILGQSVHTEGLEINGYIPRDESYGLRPSGVEASLKYNFLSPAKDDFGLATYFTSSLCTPYLLRIISDTHATGILNFLFARGRKNHIRPHKLCSFGK